MGRHRADNRRSRHLSSNAHLSAGRAPDIGKEYGLGRYIHGKVIEADYNTGTAFS